MLYAHNFSIVCRTKVSAFIISALFVARLPSLEAIFAFFRLSLLMMLFLDCFKNCISFFRFSIYFSIEFDSCLVLEVLLDCDFSQLCGGLFRFNVFSLLRRVWDSFSAFLLLDFSVILTLVLVLLVTCTTLAYVFWNHVLCLVGYGVSFICWISFVFQIILNFLNFLCCRRCLVFPSLFLMVFSILCYFFSFCHIFQMCFCIFCVI